VFRYIQQNVQFSDAYRQYNADLPGFLHNRPRDFVTHVCSRWTSAGDIPVRNIAATGDKEFAVTSVDSDNTYRVFLGTEEAMPHCDCYDWCEFHWPCKHMLALFRHTDQTWECLCPMYRDSAFFRIDADLFTGDSTSTLFDGRVSAVGSGDDGQAASDLPSSTAAEATGSSGPSVATLAAECRDVLRLLIDATYLCSSQQGLLQLRDDLRGPYVRLQKYVEHDAGLPLEKATSIPHRRQLKRRRLPLPVAAHTNSTAGCPTASDQQRAAAATPALRSRKRKAHPPDPSAAVKRVPFSTESDNDGNCLHDTGMQT